VLEVRSLEHESIESREERYSGPGQLGVIQASKAAAIIGEVSPGRVAGEGRDQAASESRVNPHAKATALTLMGTHASSRQSRNFRVAVFCRRLAPVWDCASIPT
jgi:hypothetical protein